MPTLNWIGKEAVVKHHKEVPFRLLEPVPELSCGDADSGNLIVQGDNLHALKALLPRYAGQVKCIYIDPPYNTGNEGWAYNDNVKSPEILKWLEETLAGQTVGKEGETLDRHDRWLCMMYPRLLLLKQFLREDGAIFVSIDDNEIGQLRLLMDEIFGGANLIASFVVQKRISPDGDERFVTSVHDHLVCYAKSKPTCSLNRFRRTEEADARYLNPDNDSRGPWTSSDLTRREYREHDFYPIELPSGREVSPAAGRSWAVPKDSFQRLLADNRIWFGANGNAMPRLKRFLSEVSQGIVPTTWFSVDVVSDNQKGKRELRGILYDQNDLFGTPKPRLLIQRILEIASDKDSLILDSFAGSGTTGHAVLKQNAEDGGNRRFILVEMDAKIAKDVTAERVRRVAAGYTKANGDKIEGLGGGFQYCRLSAEPLFEAGGPIRESVTFSELAEFVWFMETGAGRSGEASPIDVRKSSAFPKDTPVDHSGYAAYQDGGIAAEDSGTTIGEAELRRTSSGTAVRADDTTALLGIYGDRAVFLLYNGILKDRSDVGGNVLNGRTLEYIDSLLPGFEGERIVYGARTRFDKHKLARLGITFHQLPYDLAKKTWF